jgi:hypothetical protein
MSNKLPEFCQPGWYAAAMDRPEKAPPARDLAAEAAALAAPGMFDCPKAPNKLRLSERQCLINQERAAAGGYPSWCLGCELGVEIKARHPEGPGERVRGYKEIDHRPKPPGSQNRPKVGEEKRDPPRADNSFSGPGGEFFRGIRTEPDRRPEACATKEGNEWRK